MVAATTESPSISDAAPPKTRKAYPLTSLRFFLAIAVIFHHSRLFFFPHLVPEYFPKDYSTRLVFSPVFSVSFFFLLSGYVLSMVYLRSGQAVDKGRFFVARFARLYPLYLVMLVVGAPGVFSRTHQHGVPIGLKRATEISVVHLLMLQGWASVHMPIIDPPSWSLSAEVFFYLCFPALGVMLWKLHGKRLWLTALCVYIAGQALVLATRPYIDARQSIYIPPLHLSTFILGILLARFQVLQTQHRDGLAAKVWHVNAVFILSIGGVLLSVWLLPNFRIREPYSHGQLAPFFAGIIWALSVIPTRLSKLLSANWIVALGNASYGMYLFHYPLIPFFAHLHWLTPAGYLAYLALCIGLSLLSFYFFETPVRQWLVKHFHPRNNQHATLKR